jgi:hypothetical protein
MTLRDAHRKATNLNREEEASGSSTRYVVVAEPIGSCGGNYQLVRRRIGATTRPLTQTR